MQQVVNSLVTTVTTLNPSDIINLTATTCNPLQAGTTVDSFINASGCDSIITTVTTLLPRSHQYSHCNYLRPIISRHHSRYICSFQYL
ncbi:MAG: hypothetical protein R2728_08095 [Chitinophagales bacterium]